RTMIYFFAVLLLFLFYHFYWKRRKFPPGPTPLPLLGNLHTVLAHEPGYDAFEMWRKRYGPVYTYWIGMMPFVVVADYKTMKETFVKDGDAYAGKFTIDEVTNDYRGGRYGVLDSVGDMWRDHRRFALHVLKDLGLSTNVMEQRILREVEAMTEQLSAMRAQEIHIQEIFDVCVGSVINQLLFGYRFDEEFAHPSAAFLFAFPVFRCLPYFRGQWKKLFFYRDAFFSFFDRQIDAHQKQIDHDGDVATDYVAAFLKEQKRREAEGDYESFRHIQLQNVCLDLWIAGMETTSNTLSWGVVYILNHLDVQMKVHEEMDREIGSSRAITMADKTYLHFTCAVVNEIQRLGNIVPLNLLHETLRPVRIGGYDLPPKTGIVAQISTVLYDEEVFPDARTFNPSRFIDENGKLKKVDEFIPFSIGKRQCLGEGLAKMELFLFIANLFNRFESCLV
uniref:Cytochrome P450 domain containing protein n=1 Tax=Haemonchus contortus TaxID=6289 RepID=A0A7I4YV91_HAECO